MPEKLPQQASIGAHLGEELALQSAGAYPPSFSGAEPDEPGIHWGRYLAAVRRYKWLIAGLTIIGTALGVLATRFVKPLYTVTATIWVESAPDDKGGPIRAGGLLGGSGWTELLRAGVVLDSTALKMRLFLSHHTEDSTAFDQFRIGERFLPGSFRLSTSADGQQYELKTREGVPVDRGSTSDSIGRKAGFLWAPGMAALGRNRRIDFTVVTPREASAQLAKDLTTSTVPGNFLRLTLKGENPRFAAAVLNELTTQFVNVAADLKRRKLTIIASTLESQVKSTGEQLREAEDKLESFRVKTITLPSEGVPVVAGLQMTQPTAISNYNLQKLRLEELHRDREAMEQVLAKAQNGELAVDAFQTIPSVRNAPDLSRALTELSNMEAELRALRYRYTDEHKAVRDMQERVDVLRNQTIPSYANALITQIRSEEQTLESQVGTTSKDLQQIPIRTITEQRLTREKISAENLFQNLQNRYEETKLALASAIPDVKVLDPAIAPTSPDKNSAPMIVLMGFFGGLAAAVGLTFLLDGMDKRFRYPEQVSDDLGLSILGAVPGVRKGRGVAVGEADAAQVVEAFRTIRMNLVHSYGAAGPVLLTVSSPGPGEGKSFVCSNLALSFAEAGYRTVLVDGDIRRGELHRMFGLERRPGLMDYLGGTTTLDQIIRPSNHRALSVVPCGTRQFQGPEMLGSGAMATFMGEMKAQYKVIIVDSPPLGAGIDPFVLGTATGNMLLVMRAGETDRQMAEAKLKLLERLPVRMLGAVLNDVKTGEGAYKYYSYVYGYAADDEQIPRLESANGNGVS